MGDLLVAVLKIAFLAAIWLFILVLGNVIRNDMVGKRVSAAMVAAETPVREAWRPRFRGRSNGKPTHLTIAAGPGSGNSTRLVDGLTLGRAPDCSLLLEDDFASSHHARVTGSPETGWILEDLGSTNGTYVNGERMLAPVAVGTADVIRIGQTLLRLVD